MLKFLSLHRMRDLKADVDVIKRRMYSTYLETRPPSWEEGAVKELVTAAKDTIPNGPADGAHIHIVHLSDASASLDLIKVMNIKFFPFLATKDSNKFNVYL